MSANLISYQFKAAVMTNKFVLVLETGVGNLINKFDAIGYLQSQGIYPEIVCQGSLAACLDLIDIEAKQLSGVFEKRRFFKKKTIVFFFDCLRLPSLIASLGSTVFIQLDDRVSLARRLLYFSRAFWRLFGIHFLRIDYYAHEKVNNFRLILQILGNNEPTDDALVGLCRPNYFAQTIIQKLEHHKYRVKLDDGIQDLVLLQCGVANGLRSIKTASPKKISKIHDELRKANIDAVLVGGPADVTFAKLVEAECEIDPRLYVGQTSIKDIWKMVTVAKCIISFDSSLGHIAAYLEVPLVWVGGCGAFSRSRPWSKPHLTHFALSPTYFNFLSQNPIRESTALKFTNGTLPTDLIDTTEITSAVISICGNRLAQSTHCK